MPKASTGGVVEKTTVHGTSFALRFCALGKRQFLHLGYAADGWTRQRAEQELQYVLADVRQGIWQPPPDPEFVPEPREVPTSHEFAKGSGVYVRDFTPVIRSALTRLAHERWSAGASIWSADADGREISVGTAVTEIPVSDTPSPESYSRDQFVTALLNLEWLLLNRHGEDDPTAPVLHVEAWSYGRGGGGGTMNDLLEPGFTPATG